MDSPNLRSFVSILLLIILNSSLAHLYETKENVISNDRTSRSSASSTDKEKYGVINSESPALFDMKEYLSWLGIPTYGLVTFTEMERNSEVDLSLMEKIPESIRGIIFEMIPFIHLMNRTENITDVGLSEKCCGRYGCFTTNPPFGSTRCRPTSLLPECQDKLKVKFYLWTRNNPNDADVIDPEDSKSLLNSHFRGGTSIIININGYLSAGNTSITLDLKNAMLNNTDCMFISVDWTIGARMNYTKSTANSQVVSAVTAYFIQQLQAHYNISLEKVHIIGSSLGAQIAGGIGKRIPNIGRITGLDPAKPFFEGCDSTVYISRSDANFVDIIHTDIGMMGMAMPSGHLDIYLSGGVTQPACFGFKGCDHPMSHAYFIESITSKPSYYAYECDSYDNFMKGNCNEGCGSDNSSCAPVGYHAVEWKRHAKMSPTLMYLANEEKQPYYVFHYHVRIECKDNKTRLWRYGRNSSTLFINIIGENGETGFQQANKNALQFTSQPRITTIITSEKQIGMIKGVKLKLIRYDSPNTSKDCSQNLQEPANCSSNKEYDSDKSQCFMCPLIVSSIHVKNFESNYSEAFDGTNQQLKPLEEIMFDKKLTASQ